MLQYEAACVSLDVDSDQLVTCLPVCSRMLGEQNWQSFLCADGLHLSHEGGEFVYRILTEKVRPRVFFRTWSLD